MFSESVLELASVVYYYLQRKQEQLANSVILILAQLSSSVWVANELGEDYPDEPC